MSCVDLGRRYLELVLRLGRTAPGWVESYVGPAELAAKVAAKPPLEAGELREQAQELHQLVREHEVDVDRRTWLVAQLSAISTALA